jgi:hypothetical protein
MNKTIKACIAGAAFLGLATSGAALADGTSPAFPFAATGFVNGSGAWVDYLQSCQSDCDYEIATIVAGGDFVIPVTGYWNIQLGGAWRHDRFIYSNGEYGFTQFQSGAIGFWRDQAVGLFGVEVGLLSPVQYDDETYVKVGGVAEYYFSDMLTIGGFGGVFVPTRLHQISQSFKNVEGFYAGGHLTYYATDNFAVSAQARFSELTEERTSGPSRSNQNQALHVGGKVRYLTSMPGIEVFAGAGYRRCESVSTSRGIANTRGSDGIEVTGGISVHLGGRDDSLLNIDRSNSVDTRAWACDW